MNFAPNFRPAPPPLLLPQPAPAGQVLPSQGVEHLLADPRPLRIPRHALQTTSGSYEATSVFGVDDSAVYLLAAETSAILKAPK